MEQDDYRRVFLLWCAHGILFEELFSDGLIVHAEPCSIARDVVEKMASLQLRRQRRGGYISSSARAITTRVISPKEKRYESSFKASTSSGTIDPRRACQRPGHHADQYLAMGEWEKSALQIFSGHDLCPFQLCSNGIWLVFNQQHRKRERCLNTCSQMRYAPCSGPITRAK